MPPTKMLKTVCLEIDSGGIFYLQETIKFCQSSFES